MFADDSRLYTQITSQPGATQLQEDLEHLQMSDDDWIMSFTPDKRIVICHQYYQQEDPAEIDLHHARSINTECTSISH